MVSSATSKHIPLSAPLPSAKRAKTALSPPVADLQTVATEQPVRDESSESVIPLVQPTVQPIEPFQVLVPTVPTIFGKMKSMPTPGFVMHLINALEKVPLRLREAVSDWGYKIVAATILPEVLPELKLNQLDPRPFVCRLLPRALLKRIQKSLSERNWWQTAPSHASHCRKTIMMPETAWKGIGIMQCEGRLLEVNPDALKQFPFLVVQGFGYKPISAVRPGRIMLHELGHAVDDYLGHLYSGVSEGKAVYLSQSVEFTEAYVADVKAMGREQRQYFEAFLPREDNPRDVGAEARKEAFAELFARLQVPTDKYSDVDRLYQASFPETCEFIRREVLRPWIPLPISKTAPPVQNMPSDNGSGLSP